MRGWIAALALVLVGVVPTFAQEDLTGVWESHYLLATIVAQVRQEGTSLTGVATIYQVLSEPIVYHFTGKQKGSEIEASHPSGHSFHGRIASDGTISGVLTAKTGDRFRMEAQRRSGGSESSGKTTEGLGG